MLKEGISIKEGWLPEPLQGSNLQAPAGGAGSVLQVAQQAQRAGHSMDTVPAASPGLSTRMIPGLFELHARRDLGMSPAVRESKHSPATLHGEHPPATTTCGGDAISQPSTHPASGKAKPAHYIPPLASSTLAGAPLPGMPWGPKSLLCALSHP